MPEKNIINVGVKCETPQGPQTIAFAIGSPKPPENPTEHQKKYWKSSRGVTMPEDISKSFQKLGNLAAETNVSAADLTKHFIEENNMNNQIKEMKSGSNAQIEQVFNKEEAQNNKQEPHER